MEENAYIVNLSYDDYVRLTSYNKKRIYDLVEEKWPNQCIDIKKFVMGALNKSFFGMSSKELERTYGIDYKTTMDSLLMKYYNIALERIFNVLNKSRFVLERHNDIFVFSEFSSHIADLARMDFRADINNKGRVNPVTRLKKIKSGELKKEGSLDFKLYDNDDFRNKVEYDYDSCLNSDLEYDEKINLRESAKKVIASFEKYKFDNDKFSGDVISRIYRGFFGFRSDKIIEMMKEKGIKVPGNTLYSVIPDDMLDMFIVMINVMKKEIDNVDYFNNKYNNETVLLLDSYLIGAVAKDIYSSYYNITPLESLFAFNNSVFQDMKNVEVYKNLKNVNRTRKLKPDEKTEFEPVVGEQMLIDSFFDVENERGAR